MDARAYAVAAIFGFVGSLLVPRHGSDRKAVLAVLGIAAGIGIAAWLLAPDPFAGPSITVGTLFGIVGTLITRTASSS
jgi:CHASE2 domain-containing sensor protein